jgi:hypothetical protein
LNIEYFKYFKYVLTGWLFFQSSSDLHVAFFHGLSCSGGPSLGSRLRVVLEDIVPSLGFASLRDVDILQGLEFRLPLSTQGEYVMADGSRRTLFYVLSSFPDEVRASQWPR